jgi:hypothetical protein
MSHKYPVTAVAVTSNGRRPLSASDDNCKVANTLRLYMHDCFSVGGWTKSVASRP